MKSVRILMLALLLTVFSVGSAFAQTINIVNKLGDTIYHLGLVHESSSGDVLDLLGDGVLENGYQIPIEITGPTTGWTLIAADNEGTEAHWEDLDLTGISVLVLNEDGTIDGE